MIEKRDKYTETSYCVIKESIGVNTNEAEIDSFDNDLEIDGSGQIHPRRNELLVEIKMKHGIKDWQEIKSYISETWKTV